MYSSISNKAVSNKAGGACQHTVLIIDDNDDNLLFAQYAVEHLGYNAVPLLSGHAAVDAALTCSPAIILLDILLGGLHGTDVLHQLRQHPQLAHIPIIAVTAIAQPFAQHELLEAGFSDYFLKPYMLEDLQLLMSRHLPSHNCHEHKYHEHKCFPLDAAPPR